jgi:hypothetical protein
MALLHDGAAPRAHPGSPAGRVASPGSRLVAVGTFQRRAHPRLAPLRGLHPLALLPGRSVPDVLAVAALEQRHPVPHLVLFEPDDGAPHTISLAVRT